MVNIALAFFGLTHNLEYTMETIQKNVFDVFKEASVNYDVYLHTYSMETYNNPRSKEFNIKYNNQSYKILNSDCFHVDKKSDITNLINMSDYRTCGDPWDNNYSSVDNYILAQYSKKMVVELIESSNKNYDYILFIRPDSYFHTPLSMKHILSIKDNSIGIPKKYRYGPYRMNDRFAITTMKTYKIYGKIFDELLELSKIHELHSETILGLILKNNNITPIFYPTMNFQICKLVNENEKITYRLLNK